MTGYQSKKAAALDEEGFYTIHPKDEDDDIQVYQRPWVGLTDEEIDCYIVHRLGNATKDNLAALIRLCEARLKEKNT